MTPESLLDAIGLVDDDLLQQAEAHRPRRPLPWRPLPWRPLAGGLAACLALAALFHLPGADRAGGASGSAAGDAQSSAEMEQQAGGGPDSSASGERVSTPEGDYTLTGAQTDALPPDSVQLGVLFLEGNGGSGLTTDRADYAGCILWSAPDGNVYVQLPTGRYAVAAP